MTNPSGLEVKTPFFVPNINGTVDAVSLEQYCDKYPLNEGSSTLFTCNLNVIGFPEHTVPEVGIVYFGITEIIADCNWVVDLLTPVKELMSPEPETGNTGDPIFGFVFVQLKLGVGVLPMKLILLKSSPAHTTVSE